MPGESRDKLTAHEKAVPAMIGGHNTKPCHGGTANGQRKEAGSPTTASQVVDRLDSRFSHTGSFQTSPKCLNTKEIPALGLAPLALQGALAMPAPRKGDLPVMCSPRGVLLESRREILGCKASKPFKERIARAQRERRVRNSLKEKREWPRRKLHAPPHPPALLRLTD